MGFLLLLPLVLAGGSQLAAPDSGAVLNSARRAQAAFESTRRGSLPERPGGWSGVCGQRIGRICYWYEGDHNDTAPPEPARIREARARLLATLDEAGATLPGDEWVGGQVGVEPGPDLFPEGLVLRTEPQVHGWQASKFGRMLLKWRPTPSAGTV